MNVVLHYIEKEGGEEEKGEVMGEEELEKVEMDHEASEVDEGIEELVVKDGSPVDQEKKQKNTGLVAVRDNIPDDEFERMFQRKPVLKKSLSQANISVSVGHQGLDGPGGGGPVALILVPTRELAMQIHSHVTSVAKYTNFKVRIMVNVSPPLLTLQFFSHLCLSFSIFFPSPSYLSPLSFSLLLPPFSPPSPFLPLIPPPLSLFFTPTSLLLSPPPPPHLPSLIFLSCPLSSPSFPPSPHPFLLAMPSHHITAVLSCGGRDYKGEAGEIAESTPGHHSSHYWSSVGVYQ